MAKSGTSSPDPMPRIARLAEFALGQPEDRCRGRRSSACWPGVARLLRAGARIVSRGPRPSRRNCWGCRSCFRPSCWAVALLMLVSFSGKSIFGLWQIVVAHAIVGLPFMMRNCMASMRGIDPVLQEAAKTLGASGLRAFFENRPAAVAGRPSFSGALLVFIISFNEFTLSYFLYTIDVFPLSILALPAEQHVVQPGDLCHLHTDHPDHRRRDPGGRYAGGAQTMIPTLILHGTPFRARAISMGSGSGPRSRRVDRGRHARRHGPAAYGAGARTGRHCLGRRFEVRARRRSRAEINGIAAGAEADPMDILLRQRVRAVRPSGPKADVRQIGGAWPRRRVGLPRTGMRPSPLRRSWSCSCISDLMDSNRPIIASYGGLCWVGCKPAWPSLS